jgi:chaperonin GroEL
MNPSHQLEPRKVTFQPDTHQEILEGVDRLVNLIRPTLGPLPRHVLISREPGALPEQLDSGGGIAMRVPLSDGPSAMGTALLKNALVKQQEQVGDGTAAAAVMFQVAFHEGLKLVSAGGNAMLLRRYLDEGLQIILRSLDLQRVGLEGKEPLTRFAENICRDPHLAQYLGEIFDIIGEFGRLEIIAGKTKELEREYIDGFYWEKGIVSPHMANQPFRLEAFLENPGVLVTNYYLHDPAPLVPLLETAIAAGYANLLVVALGFSEKAIGLFVTQSNREKIWVVGVEPPATGEERLDFIQDIAVLTGATPILRASDIETELVFSTLKNLKYLTQEHFGRARRVWVTQESTVISGGNANSRYLRLYIQDLKRRYERETDETAREKLRVRLGKFLGGSATLWIGGPSPIAIQQRKELAESASQALRNAIHSGVLSGGGTALLAAIPDLQGRLRAARGLEERTAFSILIRMVKEPTRTLLSNAGLTPEPILDEILQAGPGIGYDLRTGQIGPMLEAGIYDGAAGLQMAVRTAVSTAALALSTDVIIKKKGNQRN